MLLLSPKTSIILSLLCLWKILPLPTASITTDSHMTHSFLRWVQIPPQPHTQQPPLDISRHFQLTRIKTYSLSFPCPNLPDKDRNKKDNSISSVSWLPEWYHPSTVNLEIILDIIPLLFPMATLSPNLINSPAKYLSYPSTLQSASGLSCAAPLSRKIFLLLLVTWISGQRSLPQGSCADISVEVKFPYYYWTCRDFVTVAILHVLMWWFDE